MVSKRSSLRQALLVVASLASACAMAPRPPTPPQNAPSSEGSDVDEEEAFDREIARNEDNLSSTGDIDEESQEGETASDPDSTHTPCPADMVFIADGTLRYCIDRYEAALVEIDDEGEKLFPHWLPVDGRAVRAISRPGVFPQGFISELQAEEACGASGKRLCSHTEWKTACMGPAKTTFPYGDTRSPGTCHDRGKSAVAAVFGWQALADPVAVRPRATAQRKASKRTAAQTSPRTKTRGRRGDSAKSTGDTRRQVHVTIKGRASSTSKPRAATPSANASAASKKAVSSTKTTAKNSKKRTTDTQHSSSTARHRRVKRDALPASVERSVWTQLNDPRLGQVEGALARTGSHDACVNDYGVFDMVGNLHEWVRSDASATNGTFAGGYYLDTTLNGDGCQYRTTAHSRDYHDYSTGFRCCAEATTPPVSNAAALHDGAQDRDAGGRASSE